jgi:hypothetical protein
MSKYDVVVIENDKDFLWGVLENDTEQLIDVYFFEDEAQETAVFYEKGGAFDGFTPAFMLRTVKFQSDLNKAFQQSFMT